MDENNSSSKEMYVRLEIEEKGVKPFLDNFSSMTEWINYKIITPKK